MHPYGVQAYAAADFRLDRSTYLRLRHQAGDSLAFVPGGKVDALRFLFHRVHIRQMLKLNPPGLLGAFYNVELDLRTLRYTYLPQRRPSLVHNRAGSSSRRPGRPTEPTGTLISSPASSSSDPPSPRPPC